MTLHVDIRRDRLSAIRNRVDAEGGGALQLFGVPRTTFGAAIEESPLVVASLGTVSFELHETEAILMRVVEAYTSVSGVPLWGRFVNGAGVAQWEEDAGLPGSGMPIIVVTEDETGTLYVGGICTITINVSEPA